MHPHPLRIAPSSCPPGCTCRLQQSAAPQRNELVRKLLINCSTFWISLLSANMTQMEMPGAERAQAGDSPLHGLTRGHRDRGRKPALPRYLIQPCGFFFFFPLKNTKKQKEEKISDKNTNVFLPPAPSEELFYKSFQINRDNQIFVFNSHWRYCAGTDSLGLLHSALINLPFAIQGLPRKSP